MQTALSSKQAVGCVRPSSRATRRVACAASATGGSARRTWLPNVEPPSYLDGTMPGDFGFDPLGLGADPARLKWYQEAEKTNGRWAMAAVAGILGQEALGVTPKWFEAGAKDYGTPLVPLLAIEFLIMGFLETKRYQGFKETGTSGFLNSFPFDPAGLNADKQNAVKEVKNGRLAMVAFVGFAVQALVNRMGPIEALTTHIGNPGKNITYYLTHLPETLGQ